MRIVFAGTPDFAALSLKRLIATGANIVAAYTQPDRPAGRGRRVVAGPVKQAALDAGIPVEQPTSLKNQEALLTLADYQPDIMVVAAYGLILPPAILATPPRGCLNIHASLLPRWRGAAPIQRAIIAGDQETGITIMQMDEGLDTGDILSVHRCAITDDDTGGTLHDRLADLGADAIVSALDAAAAGALKRTPQPDEGACYAHRLSVDESWVDWQLPAIDIVRTVRAFNPWPVARTDYRGQALRLWGAEMAPGAVASAPLPGTVLDVGRAGIIVQTGDGQVALTTLQRPGGKPLAARDFLNGISIASGDTFSLPAPAA